jgi:hypothetical protein
VIFDPENFIMAAYLNDAPIDRIGDWDVCWKKAGEYGIVVECSLASDTYRTVLPWGCVLVLDEEAAR